MRRQAARGLHAGVMVSANLHGLFGVNINSYGRRPREITTEINMMMTDNNDRNGVKGDRCVVPHS